MADQTEQEPIDPWEALAETVTGWNLPPARVEYLAQTLNAARAADAAHLRERDAQIARLSAQVEEKDGTIDAWEIACDDLRAERDALKADRQHMLDNWVAVEELREAEAERDAAQQEIAELHTLLNNATKLAGTEGERVRSYQQQIATLTAVATDALACWQGEDDTNDNDPHRRSRSARSRAELRARIDAALQSTRPQEQP